jgi:hypothetical protein
MLFERRVLPLKATAMLKAKLPSANTNQTAGSFATLRRR